MNTAGIISICIIGGIGVGIAGMVIVLLIAKKNESRKKEKESGEMAS